MKRTLLPTHAFINKALLLFSFTTLCSMNSFCQSGQKWATGGNNTSTGDFIGTTNNQPLIFKVNNTPALQINPTGALLVSSVSGIGKGLLNFDDSGKIIPFVFNNETTSVLTGNGAWTPASLLSGWKISGNDIVQVATGNVGIGTTTPQTKLDVNGSVSIANDLKIAGNLQLTNSTGSASRLLQIDANGMIIPFAMGNPNQVLYGNGTWDILPLAPPLAWQPSANGTGIFHSTGNVGIGTNNPQYLLDVNGSVRIANNLYVGGGIIITDKVNASSEVNTDKLTALVEVEAPMVRALQVRSLKMETEKILVEAISPDSIMMDSTTAVYGEANFNDNVRLLSKLDVANDVTLQEKLNVENDVTLQSKLDVANDVKMQSRLDVVGDVTVNGNFSVANINSTSITASTINTSNFTVNNTLNAHKIQAYRIACVPGDSLIRFGDSTVNFDPSRNRMWGGPVTTGGLTYSGWGIGSTANGLAPRSFAVGANVTTNGVNSIAMGTNATTTAAATNSVVIGYGLGTAPLINNFDHTLMVGFNSNKPTLFVSKSPGINLTGSVGIGTTDPETQLHIAGEGDQGITITTTSNASKTRLLSVFSNNNKIETQLQYNERFSLVSLGTPNVFRMIINEDGNVGIGKNPIAKLDVDGIGRFSNINGRTDIGFNSVHSYVDGSAELLLNYYSGKNVDICTNPATGGNVNMCTGTTGNVGIGTTGPVAKLDVNGNLRVASLSISGIVKSDANGLLTTIPLNTADIALWHLASNGTDIYGNNNVGIGIPLPTEKLDVAGNIKLNYNQIYLAGDHNHGLGHFSTYAGKAIDGPVLYGFAGGALGTNQAGTQNIALKWLANGNVGIGTDLTDNSYEGNPNYFKLSVNGSIRAKEVILNTGWSDFVFEKNYKLKTLAEIEQYIQQNGHLPEIPTAKEIEKNGGNIGELVKLQMQKIEELTLYIIEQNKRIEGIEKQLNNK